MSCCGGGGSAGFGFWVLDIRDAMDGGRDFVRIDHVEKCQRVLREVLFEFDDETLIAWNF